MSGEAPAAGEEGVGAAREDELGEPSTGRGLEADVVEIPNPGGGEALELPTLRAGIDVFGLAGDPADIGATPRRVVHVELLEEKPL